MWNDGCIVGILAQLIPYLIVAQWIALKPPCALSILAASIACVDHALVLNVVWHMCCIFAVSRLFQYDLHFACRHL